MAATNRDNRIAAVKPAQGSRPSADPSARLDSGPAREAPPA